MAGQAPTQLDAALGARLADRLTAGQPEIVDAWAAAVRADALIHSDDSLSYAEFVDHIPKVVAEICNLLRGAPLATGRSAIRKEARVHGTFRWRQGYDLGELMREIGHLRQVLLDFAVRGGEEAGLTSADRKAFERCVVSTLDEGQTATILTYVVERDRELAQREREIARRDQEIAERDRQLQQSLLERERSRREGLESAARAKDEFLATLSHELRTPLTPILAWVAILEKDASPSKVAGAVKTIGRNARVLLQLIDDLLDVSRIVAGKLDFTREPLDARDVVRPARDTVLPLAEAKGVTLRLVEPRDPLPVVGDATRLQQIVWNLLSNAIKFSRTGGEVRIEAGLTGDAEVRIAVADDGAGIAPDFLPHIFDRFRQQEQGSTRGHGGLGLGLAIARAITEVHGGRLTAFSEGEGRGSRFELRLPVRRG